jgi:hypothetical protein
MPKKRDPAKEILNQLRWKFAGNVAAYPTIVGEIDALIKERVKAGVAKALRAHRREDHVNEA